MMVNLAEEKIRLLERYRHVRAMSRELHNSLSDHLSKGTFTECGEKLGLLVDGSLVFETEDESSVLMDYCLYDGWSGDHNAITRCLAQNPHPPDSDETLLLEAMSKARYSLYQVESIVEGLGVNALDILRGDSLLIIDEGFSQTAAEGVIMAARIITLPDFSMTTGAALPIDAKTLAAILDALEGGPVEVGRVDYNRLSRQEEAVMSSIIIRCAVARGASSRISYEGPSRKPSLPKHVLRNDPCPCGSGRKFKKCCGRTG